ncbi:MAG: phosphotransferase [Bryobacteraceae bacterium]
MVRTHIHPLRAMVLQSVGGTAADSCLQWAKPTFSPEIRSLWMQVSQRLANQVSPIEDRDWFESLIGWTAHAIEPLGLTLTGGFDQLNADGGFSLFRIETSGTECWFKAVGPPCLSEYSVTLALSHRAPEYIPPLVADSEKWHGWLSLQACGQSLEDVGTPRAWSAAAASIARLQIGEISHSDWWLTQGCKDYRPSALACRVRQLFDSIRDAMDQAPVGSPIPLSGEQQDRLEAYLHETLDRLAGLPHTLVHGDLNPRNIFVQDDLCQFLDWAEASVGMPFLALENLLANLRRWSRGAADQEAAIRASYVTPWRSILSEELSVLGQSSAPLVRYAAMALEAERGGRDRYPLLRSLARSMWREIGEGLGRRG